MLKRSVRLLRQFVIEKPFSLVVSGLCYLAAAAAALILGEMLWLGLVNRLEPDATLMLYLGWLVDQGAVPYRDFFDLHPPGAFFIYFAVGSLSNFSDVNAQFLWVGWVLANTVALGLLLRRFGAAVAVLGASTAAIAVMPHTLQRAVFVWPVITATVWLLATRQPRRFEVFLLGAGFGVATTIRPTLGIGVLAAAVFLWRHRVSQRDGWLNLAALSAGIVVPLLMAVAYLVLNGTATPFMSMASGYWPLYFHLPLQESWSGRAVRGAFQCVPVLLGVYVAHVNLGRRPAEASANHRLHELLVAFALAYLVYVPLNGNFFSQHWLLFFWCALPALAIGASQQQRRSWRLGEAVSVAAAAAALVWIIRIEHGGSVRSGLESLDIVSQQSDAITAYLDQLPAETSVQALDWANGTARAMLNARRTPATRFIYTLPLMHDTGTAYTKRLRDRFITEFDAAKPDIVIEFKDLSADFPDAAPFVRLRERLRTEYQPAFETEEFNVLRRLDDTDIE